MNESAYVRRIQSALEVMLPNSHSIKMHGNSNMPLGTPDLFVCYRGQLLTIECKVNGNTPDEKQEYELDKWAKANAIAFWVSNDFISPEYVVKFIKSITDYRLDFLYKDVVAYPDRHQAYNYWQRKLISWMKPTVIIQ